MTEESKRIIGYNNIEYWYKGNRLHRAYGPAVFDPSTGKGEWFMNGTYFSFQEVWDQASEDDKLILIYNLPT